MSELRWISRTELDRPLMLIALKGLFDAAGAASTALDFLRIKYEAEQIADLDPEAFFNFTEERPNIVLDDNGNQNIKWPSIQCYAAKTPDDIRDLVLVCGVEPHLRWRSFCNTLLEISEGTQTEMVITIGAMVGMAPHTRPLGVVGSAANPSVADRLGLGRPSYQGPTGLIGALHDRLENSGMSVVSLRVSVPHYMPGPPNPEATRSLLARLELITGIPTNHAELNKQALNWRERIDSAVANDDELTGYVAQLEKQVDQSEAMPTGEDLAAELEAFLRDKRDGA